MKFKLKYFIIVFKKIIKKIDLKNKLYNTIIICQKTIELIIVRFVLMTLQTKE